MVAPARAGRGPLGRRALRNAGWVAAVLAVLAAGFWVLVPHPAAPRGHSVGAAAKMNARNLVSQVEACFAQTHDVRACGPRDLERTVGRTGLTFGSAPGQVTMTARSASKYTIYSYSMSGGVFIIAKLRAGSYLRLCDRGPGCAPSGKW